MQLLFNLLNIENVSICPTISLSLINILRVLIDIFDQNLSTDIRSQSLLLNKWLVQCCFRMLKLNNEMLSLQVDFSLPFQSLLSKEAMNEIVYHSIISQKKNHTEENVLSIKIIMKFLDYYISEVREGVLIGIDKAFDYIVLNHKSGFNDEIVFKLFKRLRIEKEPPLILMTITLIGRLVACKLVLLFCILSKI
jgi:hypothetical protein